MKTYGVTMRTMLRSTWVITAEDEATAEQVMRRMLTDTLKRPPLNIDAQPDHSQLVSVEEKAEGYVPPGGRDPQTGALI